MATLVVVSVLAVVVGLGTLQTYDLVGSMPIPAEERSRLVWGEAFAARGWFLLAPGIALLGEFVRVGRVAVWKLLLLHLVAGVGVAMVVHLMTPAEEPIVLVSSAGNQSFRTLDGEPLPELLEELVQQVGEEMASKVEAGVVGAGVFEQITTPESSLVPSLLRKLGLYAALVVLVGGLAFRREARGRDRHARWIEQELGRSELRALRAQLQPHFLFNTLNSLTVLIDRDVDGAKLMVRQLAGLLRATLEDIDKSQVPLRRELEVLRHYVELEQIRFGDRIRIRIDADDGLGGRLVPPFCLQPLVENSLRHGPGSVSDGGRIDVRVRHEDDALVMSVSDDGPGSSQQTPARSGFGLSNIEARLHRLYGDGARLQLDSSNSGYSATIRIRDDAPLVETQ